ncbi:MAG: 2-C-methyl-D-erythritol 2,4-cyclodiphosphate synthase [Desulfovibrio sp.]|nr:2-C-methyl-D-erythritol 2,4-cyclodiphosphate synthase [Desulfovibrio sp.]
MGSPSNTIILNTDDLPHPPVAQHLTVGQGYDVHRYGGARPMVLGGIPIPGPITIDAHSDGDVLVHAIMDALLGALALGDIGDHFPPTDPTYEGISSMLLLDMVLNLCKQAHLTILHLDATIIAQKPTIAPYREQIRKNLANALNLPRDSINIKATTEEKLGFTGHLEGIKAQAVVLCQKNPDPSPPLCDGIGQLFAF